MTENTSWEGSVFVETVFRRVLTEHRVYLELCVLYSSET